MHRRWSMRSLNGTKGRKDQFGARGFLMGGMIRCAPFYALRSALVCPHFLSLLCLSVGWGRGGFFILFFWAAGGLALKCLRQPLFWSGAKTNAMLSMRGGVLSTFFFCFGLVYLGKEREGGKGRWSYCFFFVYPLTLIPISVFSPPVFLSAPLLSKNARNTLKKRKKTVYTRDVL
ncbi:hypothetical protein B0T26DRAFT_163014 [Lasiosphaeria miniovina]|uniref:Transmembrane protein n=1 Tax=Lasiosphaeria miniovina TaxID=1954250 RepID=A0AA40B5Q7_9PEZI|nr:uncharacterized protein B0T26DRAFT_163014 [Lasiosphaeria miniovina]KAK0728201.1 hypothetical protein B0T26DRAFT_163014 [Lasiosphaeria miniovina]